MTDELTFSVNDDGVSVHVVGLSFADIVSLIYLFDHNERHLCLRLV